MTMLKQRGEAALDGAALERLRAACAEHTRLTAAIRSLRARTREARERVEHIEKVELPAALKAQALGEPGDDVIDLRSALQGLRDEATGIDGALRGLQQELRAPEREMESAARAVGTEIQCEGARKLEGIQSELEVWNTDLLAPLEPLASVATRHGRRVLDLVLEEAPLLKAIPAALASAHHIQVVSGQAVAWRKLRTGDVVPAGHPAAIAEERETDAERLEALADTSGRREAERAQQAARLRERRDVGYVGAGS